MIASDVRGVQAAGHLAENIFHQRDIFRRPAEVDIQTRLLALRPCHRRATIAAHAWLGAGCVVGAESVVRAGACVKQRDRFGDRSVLDGFPARLVGTLTDPPPVPGWALPPDAVATLRKVQR